LCLNSFVVVVIESLGYYGTLK